MTNQRLALVYRHLLLESKFIVLAITSILFLGFPYWQITTILYADFTNFKASTSLSKDLASTTGVIDKIYQIKYILPGRSPTYVFEFSYLGKNAKVSTDDHQQLNTNKIGDHVLVLYNQHAATIAHINADFLPISTILTMASMATVALFIPMLICILCMLKSFSRVWKMYKLHTRGISTIGEITYFKTLRHNAYIVEYLYTPANSLIKLRAKTKATNYAHIGEKRAGEQLNILYDQYAPTITCVSEKLYE
jgi:hypothetical protein